MTKKILITGANGQLGHEMRNLLADDSRFECRFTDVAELDICDAQAVSRALAETPVDYVVNCAAYTQVDKARRTWSCAAASTPRPWATWPGRPLPAGPA